MSGYQLPDGSYVSASWASHKDRTPPSSEPGTDYGCAYGTNICAPDAGRVTYIKTDNSGAMGRVVQYLLDDGREARVLHLSVVKASVGQRIARGQLIGISGASGYNSDWYYGPHAHQTLWPGAAWAAPTIDFALYVGSSTPSPEPPDDSDDEEDDMALRMMHWTGGAVQNPSDTTSKTRRAIWSEGSGFYMEWTESGATYANTMAEKWDTGSSAQMTQSLANAIYQTCLKIRADAGAK